MGCRQTGFGAKEGIAEMYQSPVTSLAADDVTLMPHPPSNEHHCICILVVDLAETRL
ncbi:hypothetical protein SK128_014153, partial [Halocaridina rubra]